MTMRVLHAITEMGVGGAERLVELLVDRGATTGWTSAVVSGGGLIADDLAARGVPTMPLRMARRSPLRMIGSVRDAARAVRTFEPDVVVAHNVVVTVVCWLALRLTGHRTRLVSVFHGVAAPDYPRAARLLRRTGAPVVAVSHTIAGRLVAAGLPEHRVQVIHNAVAATPPFAKAAGRRALDLPAKLPVILCIARFAPQKRHDVLLRAVAELDDTHTLLLAGEGPQLASVEALAAELGIAERVRFLGVRDDIDVLLGAADVTVLTSDWEGLPLVVLESLTAGRPVVATDVDGVREVLSEGGGTLVPPGDAAAVAAAVRALLTDKEAYAAAVEAGGNTVRSRFDPETLARKYRATLFGGSGFGGAGDVSMPGVRKHRTWLRAVAVGAVVGMLVAAVVQLTAVLQPPEFQGRIGLLALPAVPVSAEPNAPQAAASYGEVVSLALPSLTELATTPSVLEAVSNAVPGAPPAAQLRKAVGVELLAGAGVARLSVTAGDERLAAALAEALAREVIRADVLAPTAVLRELDDTATVIQTSPDPLLAGGMSLAAGVVVAAASIAVLRPRRRGGSDTEILEAVSRAGRGPVAVLDGADPALLGRIAALQRAANRPVRVVGASPDLQDQVAILERGLPPLGRNGEVERASVLTVVDRHRTSPDELTATLVSLPSQATLLGVVLV